MNPLILTATVSIGIGILSFVLSSQPSSDPFFSQKSFGYISVVLGVVTLAIGIFNSRQKKAMALLISGMILVTLGERLPQLIFKTVFGKESEADFRDAGLIFLFLGITCVVASWIILVLDGKTEK